MKGNYADNAWKAHYLLLLAILSAIVAANKEAYSKTPKRNTKYLAEHKNMLHGRYYGIWQMTGKTDVTSL